MFLPRNVQFNNQIHEYEYSRLVASNQPDKLMLTNVFTGQILSDIIYPLVYDKYLDNNFNIKYRSVPFYQEVSSDSSKYFNLSEAEIHH